MTADRGADDGRRNPLEPTHSLRSEHNQGVALGDTSQNPPVAVSGSFEPSHFYESLITWDDVLNWFAPWRKSFYPGRARLLQQRLKIGYAITSYWRRGKRKPSARAIERIASELEADAARALALARWVRARGAERGPGAVPWLRPWHVALANRQRGLPDTTTD